jgi:flagellar biosynthesis/type III secretory pathway chaperone
VELSFPQQKQEFLSRLETLKELEQTDFETYSLVKDRESGQHYLRYSFTHINLSEGGRRDEYHHFLPLQSDDVLGLMFGEQPYRFPDHWKTTYLRSGTDDRIMPFDPSENHDLEEAAKTEQAMLAKLLQYKQEWMETDDKERLTRQLFSELDELMKKPEDK